MMMSIKFYFKKTHLPTQTSFGDFFSSKNLPFWNDLKLKEVEDAIHRRIECWNKSMPGEWSYTAMGWQTDIPKWDDL